MDYKFVYGFIASATALVAYSFYIWNIYRGSTKPHAFSWLIWGFATGVVFIAQVIKGGHYGAWVTGVSCFICFVICIAAFIEGDRTPTHRDYLYLVLSLAALPIWYFLDDPTISILWITGVDVIGYLPTIEQACERPNEDSAMSFLLNSIKFIFGIAGLASYPLVTWVYPAVLVFMNGLVAAILFVRRVQTHERPLTFFGALHLLLP